MTGQLRLEIRPFATTDRETVLTLWADAFPNEPAYNQSERMIARKLRVQPELFLVAVEDGVVAGTVMAGYDGVRGWIHRLAVARTARRRGIGTALLREAEMRLLALGCPHAQGHLFSEPRSTEATETLLARAFERAPSSVRLN